MSGPRRHTLGLLELNVVTMMRSRTRSRLRIRDARQRLAALPRSSVPWKLARLIASTIDDSRPHSSQM
ncbi:MAG: hypothetical protein QOG65_3005 [Actinomycetota bacterium]|nr:hypothetical protein [Actinomycetota bacterium]